MDFRKGWWLAMAAVLLGAALTVPFRHLWEVDEPRYAEVAREMITSGQWLVPHLYGEPYTHKPPLYIWLEGGLRLTGLSWTAAGVLPSVLAFLGILALMPRLARATGLDDEVGRLGGIALAASPLAVFLALGARMDMLLAFFYTLAILMLAQLLGLGTAAVPNRRAHTVFWLAIGLGVLTKGPVAVALPVLAAVLAWALLRPRPSLRAVFVGWGPLLAVGLVLAWLVPAGFVGGPEYLYEVTIRQSAGRLTNSFAHQEPFYFYLVRYPAIGLPWSVAVVVAAFHALRRRALDAGGFLALAALAVPVFFSLISGKLEIYLLPMFPPAMLLAAHAWRRTERGQRSALAAGAAGMAVVGIAAAALPTFGLVQRVPWPVWAGVGALIAVPAVAALVAAVRGRPIASTVALVAASALVVPAGLLPVGLNALDRAWTTAGAAEAMRRAEPESREYLSYGAEFPGLWLYAERPFRELADAATVSAELGRGRCVLVEEKRWGAVQAALEPEIDRVERIPLRRRALFLVCGRRR
ncbi:MAG: phospholipid carrier-dependent glycosyltransferase [Acidobacteria bacterium]|nr:phospholipid carrier-dependent glycosyltransferase [Acidobacteriota bacterium]